MIKRSRRILSLKRRDGKLCWLCNKPMSFRFENRINEKPNAATIDHVIAKKDGGSNKLTNLKLAHRECNNNRHNSKGKIFPIITWESEGGSIFEN